LKIEDITHISNLISELNKDLKESKIPTFEDLSIRIEYIKNTAKELNVPVVLDQKYLENVFFKRIDTTPNEIYEEYSEEVEYSED
jgi:hypothetical protein